MAGLYKHVVETIRDRITTGRYRPNTALPSERELCIEFAVSRVTVRKALTVLKKQGLIVSAAGSGHFVGRKKPAQVREKGKTVVLVVPDSLFCSMTAERAIFIALRARLAEADKTLNTFMMETKDFLERAQHAAPGQAVVLFSGNDAMQRTVARTTLPLVIVGYPCKGITAPWVDVDQRMIGYDSARHILRLGHTSPAVFYHDPEHIGDRLWLKGVHQAFAEKGMRCDPKLMFNMPAETELFAISAPALSLIERLRKNKSVTAVITSNGWMASSVIHAANQLGLSIPDDLSLVAGETPSQAAGGPSMSACMVNYNVFGASIAESVLDVMEKKTSRVKPRIVPHEFVAGWTTSRRKDIHDA